MASITKNFTAGTVLFRENDHSRDMYLLHSGRVKVFRSEKGQRVDLCEMGKGGIVGEMSLLDGRARSATVEVMEDIEATVIAPDEFEKKSKQIPDWFLGIIRILCTRLRDTDRRIRASLEYDTVANIASLLSIMIDRQKLETTASNDKNDIDLKFAKTEMMEILSLTHDKVSVAMKEIEMQKLVRIANNRLSIPDRSALELFSKYKRGEASDSSIEASVEISGPALEVLRSLYNAVKNGKQDKNGCIELDLSTPGETANLLFENGDFLKELSAMEIVSFDEKTLLENKGKETAKVTVNVRKISAILAAVLFRSTVGMDRTFEEMTA